MPVDLGRAMVETPRAMCLVFLLALFAPRLAFALMWIFGDRVDLAFSSFLWPLLLLIFLPWTGIMYTLLWSPVVGVDGAEWILIALAVFIDLASWSARAAKNRYSY
jgi:hypothetical protein